MPRLLVSFFSPVFPYFLYSFPLPWFYTSLQLGKLRTFFGFRFRFSPIETARRMRRAAAIGIGIETLECWGNVFVKWKLFLEVVSGFLILTATTQERQQQQTKLQVLLLCCCCCCNAVVFWQLLLLLLLFNWRHTPSASVFIKYISPSIIYIYCIYGICIYLFIDCYLQAGNLCARLDFLITF